jgi:hypothetical protein
LVDRRLPNGQTSFRREAEPSDIAKGASL